MNSLELQKLISDIDNLVSKLDTKNTENIVKLAKLAILSKELDSLTGLQHSFLSNRDCTSERIDHTYKEILNKIAKV